MIHRTIAAWRARPAATPTPAPTPDVPDRVFPPELCDWTLVKDRPIDGYGDWSHQR